MQSDQAKTVAGVLLWLDEFAAAVRDADYTAGEAMFAEDVVSCGTRTPWMVGRDALIDEQWRPIWSTTRDFGFKRDSIRCQLDGDHAWIASQWSSQGRSPDGEWFDRNGRVTLVLRWRNECWLAVHSHFSLAPGDVVPVGTAS